MRLGPRARARLRKRNAVNAAARLRATRADPRGGLLPLDHMVRLHVKAVGAAEPVGTPVMPQNKLHDGVTLRATHRANGGLSKGIVEVPISAAPKACAQPSYVAPGDPGHLLKDRWANS